MNSSNFHSNVFMILKLKKNYLLFSFI